MLLSYEKVKHIVEVDENILAVFTMNSDRKISDMFIAADAKNDESFIEKIRSKLDFKFGAIDEATTTNIEEDTKEKSRTQIGKHLWDISEYDNIRVIKFTKTVSIVVLTKRVLETKGSAGVRNYL